MPSRNGATVIAFPGRSGPQKHARMLVRHGYGVLLFDRRGEGASDGDPNAFGWGGERDLLAAVGISCAAAPTSIPAGSAAIGLSVGGEMLHPRGGRTRMRSTRSCPKGRAGSRLRDGVRERRSLSDRTSLAARRSLTGARWLSSRTTCRRRA